MDRIFLQLGSYRSHPSMTPYLKKDEADWQANSERICGISGFFLQNLLDADRLLVPCIHDLVPVSGGSAAGQEGPTHVRLHPALLPVLLRPLRAGGMRGEIGRRGLPRGAPKGGSQGGLPRGGRGMYGCRSGMQCAGSVRSAVFSNFLMPLRHAQMAISTRCQLGSRLR